MRPPSRRAASAGHAAHVQGSGKGQPLLHVWPLSVSRATAWPALWGVFAACWIHLHLTAGLSLLPTGLTCIHLLAFVVSVSDGITASIC